MATCLLSQITEFYVDPCNARLREYYDTDNIWKILGIERDENRHSAFLAWIFGKYAMDKSSFLYKFIKLLMLRRKDLCADEGKMIFLTTDDLERIALSQSIMTLLLKIKDVEVYTEKLISSLSQIRVDDRLDIYLDCEIAGVRNYNRLEIFIENKINAKEGGQKKSLKKGLTPTPQEVHYMGLDQTQRYHYACSKANGLRQLPFDKDKTLQLFVYLTVKPEQASDPHYINITYQDLVDYVLEPYLDRLNADAYVVSAIKEYLRNLCNPGKNNIVMADNKEERALLADFYARNIDLFRRALEVSCKDSSLDEEERIQRKVLLDSITSSRTPRFYDVAISGKLVGERLKMYEVVAEFVKFRLRSEGASVNDATLQRINDEINSFLSRYSISRINVSLYENEVKYYQQGQYVATYDDQIFYVTKQWGASGTDVSFLNFMEGVKAAYPDFVIAESPK